MSEPSGNERADLPAELCPESSDSTLLQEIAERKRTEADLQRSQQRLKEAQTIAGIGDWEHDLVTGHVRWSEILFRLFDRDPAKGPPSYAELLGFFCPDDAERLNQSTLRAIETGVGYELDLQLRTESGRDAYQFLAGHAVKDADGKVVRLRGIVQDITLRKQAEENLRQSNSRYAAQRTALMKVTQSQVLEMNDLASALQEITEIVSTTLGVERVSVWRFDEHRTAIICRDLFQATAASHSSGTELRGDLYPGYFRALAENEVIAADDARTDHRTREFTEHYLKPLGIVAMLDAPFHLGGALEGVLCLEQVGTPRRWMDDEQSFTVSIANFISLVLARWELTRAEEAIRISEANLNAAQRIAGMGSWVWDIVSDHVHWSEEVYRLFGVAPQPQETLQTTFLQRVHVDDRPAVVAALNNAMAGKDAYNVEHRIIRSDGTEVIVHEQGEVEFDESGQAVRMTGTVLDITERKRAESQLLHDALHDSLTGLANRSLLANQIETAFNRFQRQPEHTFALILADLDRFKTINDTLGHLAGDQVLMETARRFRSATRNGDTIARLGGDEFAILLEDLSHEDSPTRVAQRVLRAMNAPIYVNGTPTEIGVSLGIVVATPDHQSTEALFSDADIALYRAKDAGRGTYQVFDQEMHRRIQERMELETQLRGAVDRGEMLLFLQPIINLTTGAIVSFEALLRWKHPARGFVAPALFIPMAEETGLIGTIGNWVVGEAIRILQTWPGASPPPVSINVSPAELHPRRPNALYPGNPTSTEEFDGKILRRTSEAGIDPELLRIEITETVLIADPRHTGALLHRLASSGFKLLLDDFGIGYSSLSYLQDLPFYQIKLDQSFTAKLEPGNRSHELMRGIVSLAHNLGLEIVAEGVETEQQLGLLRTAGCNHAQGYLISRPAPVEDAQALYLAGKRW